MPKHIAIVTPVFDDWNAFEMLLAELSNELSGADVLVSIVAVDDGSTVPFDGTKVHLASESCIESVEVIHLATNLGHQRAIAVGLTTIVGRDIRGAIVMDSDGEDRPSDVARILSVAKENDARIIMATRAKRTESRTFRIGYAVYKTLYSLLTGQRIEFGNFCYLPARAVERLVYVSHIWNHLASAVLRSRLPYIQLPAERGVRYSGSSKMSFVSLVIHGLSAFSVNTDIIFTRMLMCASGLAFATTVAIAVAVGIRVLTDLAIPGWTTTVVAAMSIILLQTIMLVVATSLIILSGRSNRQFIPIIDCKAFVAGRTRIDVRKTMSTITWA